MLFKFDGDGLFAALPVIEGYVCTIIRPLDIVVSLIAVSVVGREAFELECRIIVIYLIDSSPAAEQPRSFLDNDSVLAVCEFKAFGVTVIPIRIDGVQCSTNGSQNKADNCALYCALIPFFDFIRINNGQFPKVTLFR